MKRWTAVAALSLGLLAAASSCGPDAAERLCDPGTVVFCRCRGFEAGDKQCAAAGDGFGPCQVDGATCDEVPEPPGTGSGASGSSGSSMKPPAAGELYAACATQADCKPELQCERGYCTKSCLSYEECAVGDCVQKDGMTLCSPYCLEQKDCESYGEAVSCGYTGAAVPVFDVVVCADWGVPALPPDGYPPSGNCDTDARCHLGFTGKERVCEPGGCADGCHIQSDCADANANCSSDGSSLGSCKAEPAGGVDACPGLQVTVDLGANSTHKLTGDTSLLRKPAEETGVSQNSCFFSMNETEEAIYQVTAADAGSLVMLLSPGAAFDSQLYGRTGTCDSGEQVFCEDEIGDGKGEIYEHAMKAGEVVWIFVDGWDGSEGPYALELDFSNP